MLAQNLRKDKGPNYFIAAFFTTELHDQPYKLVKFQKIDSKWQAAQTRHAKSKEKGQTFQQ